jgi:hypothetical protein
MDVQQYPVKARNHPPLTPERIEEVARREFSEVARDGAAVHASFGAISDLKGWVSTKALAVELRMNPAVDSEVQAETIRRYNRFLEELTGFSSKERAKRLKKAVAPSDE